MRPRFFHLLIFVAALSLPVASAWSRAGSGGESCARGFSKFRASFGKHQEEVRRYWEKQFAFLDAAPKSPFSRLSEAGVSIVRNGLKVLLAPTVLSVDLLAAPIRAALEIRRGKQTYHRLFFIPLDIAERNGAHLAAYAGLTATGFTATNLYLNNTTFVEDMIAVPPDMPALREDEIVVLVHPARDRELGDVVLDPIRRAYLDRGVPSEKIHSIYPRYNEDIFEDLGKLREHGRIRDIHWMAHGTPGEMDINSGGPFGMPTRPMPLNSETLKKYAYLINRWPADLISENARLNLFSCTVAGGEKGRTFVKELSMLTLQGRGVVTAPTRLLNGAPKMKTYGEYFHDLVTSAPAINEENRLVQQAFAHSTVVPFLYGYHLFALAMSTESNGIELKPVEIIQLPSAR